MSTLDDVRFWLQIVRDQRRTVLCSPELESRVKGMVDAYGAGHLITVKVNEHMPDDRVYVVDEQAIAANLSKPIKFPPNLLE